MSVSCKHYYAALQLALVLLKSNTLNKVLKYLFAPLINDKFYTLNKIKNWLVNKQTLAPS